MQESKGAGEIIGVWMELQFVFLKMCVTSPKLTRKPWWVDPSQQQSTHTAAGWGENRRKATRLVDQDKDSLIGETKAVHASKTK